MVIFQKFEKQFKNIVHTLYGYQKTLLEYKQRRLWKEKKDFGCKNNRQRTTLVVGE